MTKELRLLYMYLYIKYCLRIKHTIQVIMYHEHVPSANAGC